MKKRKVVVYPTIALLVFSFTVMSGYSQEDVETVEDSAFEEKMRPTVSFMHDEHNETAGIEACDVCHHVYEKGERVAYDSSEGQECSECHPHDGDENPISLVRVYHLRCKGCHQEKKDGPVMCGECHKK